MKYLLVIYLMVGPQPVQLPPYQTIGVAECIKAGKEYHETLPDVYKFSCMPAKIYHASHG